MQEVTHGARDQVGSHILMCVRYSLMALCALVVLTVMLGTYAMAVRVLGTDGTSLVTVVRSRRKCTGRMVRCAAENLGGTMSNVAQGLSDALDAARRSSDLSMALALVIIGLGWAASEMGWCRLSWARMRAVVNRAHDLVQRCAGVAALVCFAYVLVASGDGASTDDLQAYNDMLHEHAADDWCMFHADVACRLSEMWSQAMIMPAVHPLAELVMLAEADGCDPSSAVVMDTGARRSVMRDPACFDRATCRPAPFRVRGVLGASGQPDFMGNATAYLPVADTAVGGATRVEAVVLIDAVCIPACPHDIIAIGPLISSGASMWLAPGSGLSWLRLCTGSYTRLYNRAIIFANVGAAPRAVMVAVSGDHATSRLPTPVVAESDTRKRSFYMCSGRLGNPTGFAAWWNHVSGGGMCTELDKVNSAQGDMLLNTSFAPFYSDVTEGVYHAGLLTPPCGQFNPRRFVFPDARFPVLRTLADFGMGISGLDARIQRSVDAVNVLAARVCLVARAMFDLRRPWVIENPPTRSADGGVFGRFYRPQLREHASFFTLPCVQELAKHTGALYAHLPMCWFGMPEQKYLTFMYPPYMHAAIQCLEGVRCVHAKHASIAGGFDADGNPTGSETGVHPNGLSELLARASFDPTVPCMLVRSACGRYGHRRRRDTRWLPRRSPRGTRGRSHSWEAGQAVQHDQSECARAVS